MCFTELKFNIDCLIKWFNRKCKSQYLEIDLISKKKFEEKNPIDWSNDKCVGQNLMKWHIMIL